MSTQIYIETSFAASGSLPGLGHWYVRISNSSGPERILLGSCPMMTNEAPARAIIESLRVLDSKTCGDVTVHAPDIPEMWNIAYPWGTPQAWQDAAQLADEFGATLCAMNETGLAAWLTGPLVAGRGEECPNSQKNDAWTRVDQQPVHQAAPDQATRHLYAG